MGKEVENQLPSDLVDVGTSSGSVPMDLNTLPEDARTVDPAFTAKQISPINPTAIGASAALVAPPVIKNVISNYKNPANAAPVVGSTPGHTPYNPRGVSVENSVENWRSYNEAQNEAAKGVRRESGLHKKYPNFSRAAPPTPPTPGGIIGRAGAQVPKVVNAIDAALVPHGTSFASKAFRGAGRALQGAGAGFQASDAYNRYQAGDYPGAAISTVGALGNLATLVPSPYSRVGGTGVAIGAEALNAYLDNMRKGNIEHGAPSEEQSSISNPMAQGGLVHLAKGGDPEFGEARAYEPSYSEKIRDLAAKYMSPERADVLFGGPRAQTVDKLNPIGMALQTPGAIADAAQGFMGRAQEGNYPAAMGNYAVGALNALPLVKPAGQVAKTAVRELGPKAAGMAEDYLTKIGGIAHAVPNDTKIVRASEAFAPHEGKWLNTTQSDRMRSTGGDLGGPGFSRFQQIDPAYKDAAWGVGKPSTATGIVNLNQRFPEGQAVWSPMIGAETQHHSNQHVYDALTNEFSRQAGMGKLTPELRKEMNARLMQYPEYAKLFEKGIDVGNPEHIKNLGNTFDRRGAISTVISGKGVGGKKGQIFDYPGIMQEMTDPMTVGAPTHSVGTRLFTLNNQVAHRPDLHSAFPYILKGEDQGVAFNPVPKELAIPDWLQLVKDFKGREAGYMDFTRGLKGKGTPNQRITEKWLRGLEDAGHAAGGSIVKGVLSKLNKVNPAEFHPNLSIKPSEVANQVFKTKSPQEAKTFQEFYEESLKRANENK